MKATVVYLCLLVPLTALAQKKGVINTNIFSKSKKESQDTTTRLIVDWPYVSEGKVYQSIYAHIPQDTTCNIDIVSYILLAGDSVKCYAVNRREVDFKKGSSITEICLSQNTNSGSLTYLESIAKTGIVPPGKYYTHLKLSNPEGKILAERNFYRELDSSLKKGSDLRDEINRGLSTNKFSKLSAGSKRPSNQETDLANKKIARKLKKYGVTTQPENINGRSFSAVYYKEWFLGRYEILPNANLQSKIKRELSSANNPASGIDNEYTSFTTITSSSKDLFKKEEKKKNNQGMIDISSNWANNQEPGSEVSNNNQEVLGQLNTTVMGIPVAIEGYYTTQDKGRIAKASYFRLSYDVEQTKSNVTEQTDVFKSKYRQTKAKAGNFDYTTNVLINKLQSEEGKLLAELKDKFGTDDVSVLDTSNLQDRITPEEVTELKQKLDKVKKIRTDVARYHAMSSQYKDGLFFDSSLVYSRIEDVQSEESIRRLTKSATNLLPESKTKRILSGLTNLKVGILNESASRYTLNGQTLKGGIIGYDFNFVEVSAAVGKTEYISRDGNLDRYNTSMLKFDFRQAYKQKVGLIYYLNSPTRQVFQSDNFKSDVSIPTLKSPTHVTALNYEGDITKYVRSRAEVAASFRQSDADRDVSKDNMAIIAGLDFEIPRTTSSLTGEWERVGRKFENSSLPYTNAATERYTVASKSTIIRSMIAVGVQYNILKQSTFSSTAISKKWGFDIKTSFKRYPNVYLSYKPFSVFRSHTDTQAIQQRPMIGEVWIARGSYRIKNNHYSHSFTAVYNKNNSAMDTIQYSSSTVQVGYSLSMKSDMINLNVGWMDIPAGNPQMAQSYFGQLSGSKALNENISVMAGQELAFSKIGLQRNSTTAGAQYLFNKLPLSVRTNLRYGSFKTDQMSNEKLWSVHVGATIYFRNKNQMQ